MPEKDTSGDQTTLNEPNDWAPILHRALNNPNIPQHIKDEIMKAIKDNIDISGIL